MKPFQISILTVLLGLAFVLPEADARGGGNRGGGGGGGKARMSQGGGARAVKRSPMTGSKVKQRPAYKPAARPATKPAARPAQRPAAKPAAKPAARPAQRPTTKPAQRPSVERPTTKPAERPGNKPGGVNRPGGGNNPGDINRPDNRPDNRPGGANRPDNRPNVNRPNGNRPNTLPGMVTYPNRPANKPGKGNGNRVGNNTNIRGGNNTINKGGNRYKNNTYVNNVNVNRRNNGLNRPATLPANQRNWNNNKWGGGRNNVWGNNNNVNVRINNNFRNNNNYAYRPNYWGSKPWWGAGGCHGWHHGHWNYGWNKAYYRRWYWADQSRNDFASGFMWGIAAWSMGNMVYNMGYKTYSNPYPAPPVQNTYITYAQPLSVVAAENPPGDDAVADAADATSEKAMERSRAAFKQGDYVTASRAVDEALAATPGDVTLHEYRALVFFALGKYADAAGVLNPVLASGPGWGWDTMVGFYGSSSTYDAQLRKLEDYVKGTPDGADGHFVLGYHYLVCGHTDKAHEQFAKTVELQPADSIARQLRDLTLDSLPEGEEPEPEAAPPPVPTEKLVGNWVSDRGADGKITFDMKESGDFTWSYVNGDQKSDLKGTYGLDDQGLLVLTMEDSQMVSEITMEADNQMKFEIIGSPDGDPGLDFKKG